MKICVCVICLLLVQARMVVQCALCRCILSWNMGLDNEVQSLELLCCLVRSMMPSSVQDLKQLTDLLLHCKPENRSAKKMLYSVLQVFKVLHCEFNLFFLVQLFFLMYC